MGGVGSGRYWHYGAKDTTEGYRPVDVRRWKRDGLLSPGKSFAWQWSHHEEVVASIRVRSEYGKVVLTYRQRSGGSDWRDESYPVYLDWTSCHVGGQRPWFLCPARDCGRRVAILYGGGIFACRKCRQLSYASQREAPYDRAARKADRIRKKLGWDPGILNGDGVKPKRMHLSTFNRLSTPHDALVQKSLAGITAKLNKLEDLF